MRAGWSRTGSSDLIIFLHVRMTEKRYQLTSVLIDTIETARSMRTLVSSLERLRNLSAAGSLPAGKRRCVRFHIAGAVDTTSQEEVDAYISALREAHAASVAADAKALTVVRSSLGDACADVAENTTRMRVRLADLLDASCRHWLRAIFNAADEEEEEEEEGNGGSINSNSSSSSPSPFNTADESFCSASEGTNSSSSSGGSSSGGSQREGPTRVRIQMLTSQSSLRFNDDCVASIVFRALRDVHYATAAVTAATITAAVTTAAATTAAAAAPAPLTNDVAAHRFLLRVFSDPAVLHDATVGVAAVESNAEREPTALTESGGGVAAEGDASCSTASFKSPGPATPAPAASTKSPPLAVSRTVVAAWSALRRSVTIARDLGCEQLAPLVPLLDVRSMLAHFVASIDAAKRATEQRSLPPPPAFPALAVLPPDASAQDRRRAAQAFALASKARKKRAKAKAKSKGKGRKRKRNNNTAAGGTGQLTGYVNASTVFVFPSLRFGFGNAVGKRQARGGSTTLGYRAEWLCPHCSKVVKCEGGAPECACTQCGRWLHLKCARKNARGAARFAMEGKALRCPQCAMQR